MKKYLPYIFIILLFFFYLVFSFPISIFPEIQMFPYLIHKGLVPYRDFFDHHGFLLYYLIAPFVTTTTIPQKIIFVILQIVSLLLFMTILSGMKVSKRKFAGLSFSYALTLYYLSDNTLWYETLITPLLLMLYLVLHQKKNGLTILISSALVFFLSSIKPLYILSFAPVIMIWRTIRPVMVIFLFWIAVLLYFLSQNALFPLYQMLIAYNASVAIHLYNSPFRDPVIIIPLLALSLISLVICFKKNREKFILQSLFLLLSSIPLLTGFWKPHMVPFATFLLIIISVSIIKNKIFAKVALIVLIAVSLFITRRILLDSKFPDSLRSLFADDQRSIKAIHYLKNNNPEIRMYVFSNRPEFYTELDVLPFVYLPLKLLSVQKYFVHYEKGIVNSINTYHIKRLILSKPLDIEFENQIYLKKWIMENSAVEYEDEYTQIRLIGDVRN